MVMEGIGSLCLVFFAGWSWITVSEFEYRQVSKANPKAFPNPPNTPFLPESAPLITVGLIHFYLITIMTWIAAPISGAHFNPAITLGLVLTRNLQMLTGIFYVVSQLAGSIAGTLLFMAIIPNEMNKRAEMNSIINGCPKIHFDMIFFGFVCEAVGGFILMFIFYAVMIEKKSGKHTFGISVGAVIATTVMALGVYEKDKNGFIAGNISAGALNPARSFGPTLFKGQFKQWWVLLIAPLVGSSLAALIYKFFLHKKEIEDIDDEDLTIEM